MGGGGSRAGRTASGTASVPQHVRGDAVVAVMLVPLVWLVSFMVVLVTVVLL